MCNDVKPCFPLRFAGRAEAEASDFAMVWVGHCLAERIDCAGLVEAKRVGCDVDVMYVVPLYSVAGDGEAGG